MAVCACKGDSSENIRSGCKQLSKHCHRTALEGRVPHFFTITIKVHLIVHTGAGLY